MSDKEWLESLKVGDRVYCSGNYGNFGGIYTVKRLTKTQIIVGPHDIKFRKNDGWEVAGDRWHKKNISPVTPEILQNKRLWNLEKVALVLKQTLGFPDKKNEDRLKAYITALEAAHEACQAMEVDNGTGE